MSKMGFLKSNLCAAPKSMVLSCFGLKSKGSLSQLMDDLDLINSVEQVEAMVNSIQKGVENVLRK